MAYRSMPIQQISPDSDIDNFISQDPEILKILVRTLVHKHLGNRRVKISFYVANDQNTLKKNKIENEPF